MLDENLPTFHLKPSTDNPSTSILSLTQHGSDPSPEYLFRRADPTVQPASRNKYAAALCSAYAGADVVYAEVVVEPEWTQPSLSAAELRHHTASSCGSPAAAPAPVVPDCFTVQLYDPDQKVTLRTLTSTWTKSDSWEFEMPTQSFRMPSSSTLDREREDARTTSSPDGLAVPRVVFRWKRDGRLSKDMTCYLVGKNLGAGRKSKEPDITVALFKAGKESAVTIYEPNLQRVEVEDRKGLEVVLLLGAEVIRDLYLVPRQDVFNVSGGSGATAAAKVSGGRRNNSRPSPSPPAAMSGALGNVPTPQAPAAHAPAGPSPPPNATAGIEAETRRLQAMVAQEEEREREKREKAEQKRIKKMLEDEEKERRRREAEVAKETERLKKLYGVQGQDLPSSSSPPLPPRQTQQGPSGALYHPPQGPGAGWYGPGAPSPHLPPRPVSVGLPPHHAPGPFSSGTLNSWWRGPGGAAPPVQQQHNGTTQRSGSGGGGAGLGILNPAAARSGFSGSGREEERERKKVQKKRSMHW